MGKNILIFIFPKLNEEKTVKEIVYFFIKFLSQLLEYVNK